MASIIPEFDFEIPPGLANLACEGSQSAPIEELDENQKRWLVIGICLQSIVAPVLRETVAPALKHLYDTLVKSCHIDTQLFPNHMKKHPATNTYELNYQSINNNKAIKGPSKNNPSYDYKVQDPVEFSKLFLATNMALFTGFDESCDTSALLGILEKIDVFDPAIRQAAEQTRINVRNPWAHCNFQEWDKTKYEDCFKNFKALIRSLKLMKDREAETTEKLNDLKTHGMYITSGKILKAGLQALVSHVKNITSQTEDNFRIVSSEFNKLYTIIKGHEKEIQMLKSGKTSKQRTHIFLAPIRREVIAGREEYLKEIEKILFKKESVKKHKVVLCGLGGIGKTTIAAEYAGTKHTLYPGGVFWLSGETHDSFENYIHRIAAEVGVSGKSFQEMFAKTLSWISNLQKLSLLIVDNVDENNITDARLEFIHNAKLSDDLHHMVITSRLKPLQAEENFICENCIAVEKLSVYESIEFMKQRTKMEQTNQDAVIKQVCLKLDCLPLALEQAALMIRSTKCSFTAYNDELKKKELKLLSNEVICHSATTRDANRLSVNTTWLINIEKIEMKSKMMDCQAEVGILMDIISCLAGDDIPVAFFNGGEPPVQYQNLAKILENEFNSRQLLDLLCEFSLLKESDDSLTVHKLVQTVIRDKISADESRRTTIIQCATRMIWKAASTARKKLDERMILRLEGQCKALKQITSEWTIDLQTSTALQSLSNKLDKDFRYICN